MKKQHWLFAIVTLVVVVTVCVLVGLFLLPKNTPISNPDSSATNSANLQNQEPLPPDPLRPVNFLLLGYGGAGHDGGLLTDSIILAQVVPHDQKVYLLNIPRDLWVSINTKDGQVRDMKINAAYANGGGENSIAAVSEIIDQPIDYYMAVDFRGFKTGLDVLTNNKGLEIDAPYAFTDAYYPLTGKEDDPCDFSEEEIASLSATLSGYELEQQFTCRYETITYPKGKQTLDSESALKFVRSRHSGTGGGDFGRSQRQQAFIKAVKDKVLSLGIIPKLPSLWSEYKKNVTTNLDLELITRALGNWGELSDFEIVSMVITNQNVLQDGRSPDGQYILRPKAGIDDYSEVREFMEISKQGLDWQDYQASKSAIIVSPTPSANTNLTPPTTNSTPTPSPAASNIKMISPVTILNDN